MKLFPKWLMRCFWRTIVFAPIIGVFLFAGCIVAGIYSGDPIIRMLVEEPMSQFVNGIALMIGFFTMLNNGPMVSTFTAYTKFTEADRHGLDWTQKGWGERCVLAMYLLTAVIWAIAFGGVLFWQWSPFITIPYLIVAHFVTTLEFALIYGQSDLDYHFEMKDKYPPSPQQLLPLNNST